MKLNNVREGYSIPAPHPGVVGGFIEVAPTAPGDAAGHLYTVVLNFPTGVKRFTNVRNALMPLDGAADTKPARVGDPVLAFMAGNKLTVLIWPQPDVAACE